MASVNDKVNLQVKVSAANGNLLQFQFKFISYESYSVALSNYRVIGYFNTFRRSADLQCNSSYGGSAGPSGTTGALTTVDASITTDFFSIANPPRIYPTNKRYDKEIICPFTGTATITAAGGYFENRDYQLHNAGWQDFISENIGSSTYKSGQAALADGYTYASGATYVDNASFILEFYDGSKWLKVTEYSNASTIDTNTGLYPYDWRYEAKKLIGDTNRLYGYDTKYDHDGINATFDSYIDQANPAIAYPTATSFSFDGSATSVPSMRVGLFKFATAALAGKSISAAEFYVRLGASQQDVIVDCALNTIDVDDSSTWNSNAAGLAGTVESSTNVTTSFSFLNSYVAWNINKDVVQGWETASATNLGINLKYQTPFNKNSYQSPVVYLKEYSSSYQPTLFVYSGPITATSIYKRWQGNTSTSWDVASNWEGGVVPSDSDIATFDESFSTNDCILNSSQTILNLSAVGGSYSGSINLSSSTLTINALDSFNLSPYSNFVSSASTLNIAANISCNFGFKTVNSLILGNGATLSYGGITTHTLYLSANKTLAGDIAANTYVVINSGGSANLGSNSIITGPLSLQLYQHAILSSAGTLSNTSVSYYGSSEICSRTYDCPVNLILPGSYSAAHDTNCVTTFTSGTCIFNHLFTVADDYYVNSYMYLDMSANNPTFVFNGMTLTNTDYPRTGLSIRFPSSTSTFNGDLTISDLLSATSNTSACTWILNGNNLIRPISLSAYKWPNMIKSDASILDLGGSTIIYENFTFNRPSILHTNGFNIISNNSITIFGDNSTLDDLGGNILSANNISMNGLTSINMLNAAASTPWSANATTSLNANLVNLQNSVASSARGYAIHSIDGGSNVNWFFDVVPPTITKVSATPASYSKTPITVSYNAYDSGAIDIANVGLVGSFGVIQNKVQVNSNNVTFDVVLSGSDKAGYVTVSASDQALNYSQLIDGPYSYDNTVPVISVVTVTPPTSSSNNYIDITVQAIDNCIFDESTSANIFKATWDSISVLPTSIAKITSANYTATYRLSSLNTLLNGDLYISATDAALNTGSFYSNALSINKGVTTVEFKSDPVSKVGYTYINVSATFQDILGMNTFIPYQMMYNGRNFPFSTIYQTSVKVLLSGSILSSMGDGILSVSGYNSVGVFTTSSDSGYKFIPTIIFGDPIPSNISKTTITVPISAIGSFTTDVNNYYCKLSATRMPISQPILSSMIVQGYTFDYLKFSATVSSVNDIRGELILSAGY